MYRLEKKSKFFTLQNYNAQTFLINHVAQVLGCFEFDFISLSFSKQIIISEDVELNLISDCREAIFPENYDLANVALKSRILAPKVYKSLIKLTYERCLGLIRRL